MPRSGERDYQLRRSQKTFTLNYQFDGVPAIRRDAKFANEIQHPEGQHDLANSHSDLGSKMTQPDVGGSSALVMAASEFEEAGTEAIRLLCGERRRVDVSVSRRTLADAVVAWPGEVGERWWKWLVETSRSLSYTAQVIDASSREVFELLRHGVAAVTLSEGASEQRLLVLTGTKRQKFRLCELP